MPNEVVKEFLDSVVTSRLGIRMLAEHHLAMHQVVVSISPLFQIKKQSQTAHRLVVQGVGSATYALLQHLEDSYQMRCPLEKPC